MKSILLMVACMALGPFGLMGQKLDDERMKRDIEVAENVLGTLIRQQFNNQRTFFPLEVKGSYQAGYGVTFSLPADFTMPIVFSMSNGNDNVFISGGANRMNAPNGFSYEMDVDEESDSNSDRLKDKVKEKKRMDMDSIRDSYNEKVLDAAKTFIADYADMITQLQPEERIVVSNQGNQPRVWVNQIFRATKRTHLSVEATKSDVASYRQGKLSREQLMSKIKVVNTESVDKAEPDLELLATMFNRLYSPDLSKTFFTENNVYYERLKDFGVIYYMQVFSSIETDYGRFRMPTLGLSDLDMEAKNKKIKEIYPKFEQTLKEDILEYGRTVKSLSDNEVLVFQVKVTKCKECGIPSTLEYTVKGDVLRDFNAAKLDRDSALKKISIKKAAMQ